jgi:hypothetical protein
MGHPLCYDLENKMRKYKAALLIWYGSFDIIRKKSKFSPFGYVLHVAIHGFLISRTRPTVILVKLKRPWNFGDLQ